MLFVRKLSSRWSYWFHSSGGCEPWQIKMSQIKTICFNLLESGGGGGGGAEHIPNKTIHSATFTFCKNALICKISTIAHRFIFWTKNRRQIVKVDRLDWPEIAYLSETSWTPFCSMVYLRRVELSQMINNHHQWDELNWVKWLIIIIINGGILSPDRFPPLSSRTKTHHGGNLSWWEYAGRPSASCCCWWYKLSSEWVRKTQLMSLISGRPD